MRIKELEEILPRFTGLVGAYVDEYKATIDKIFVGFVGGDFNWLLLINPNINNIRNTKLHEGDKFTICVLFDNKLLTGIRQVVERVNMADLLEVVQSLEYVQPGELYQNPSSHEDGKL